MNTYLVTYYPPNATPQPVLVTVQAADFVTEDDVLLFRDSTGEFVFAVARELLPVVNRTATG